MRYTRLHDRENRNGKELGRKQVFLGSDSNEKFVEMRFSANYAPLYRKTLLAFERVSPVFIGKLLKADDENFILKVEYLGRPLEPTQSNLPKVVRFLEKFSGSSKGGSKFEQWRYLTSLVEHTGNQMITAFVKDIMSTVITVQSGNGIDDPVISNFTEDKTGVHIVDLDHFSSDHSLYYQVGFVIADVDILSGSPLSSKIEDLLHRCEKYGSHATIPRQEMMPLLVGYISRLGIDVINSGKGLDSYRSSESLDCIVALASEFSATTYQSSPSSASSS